MSVKGVLLTGSDTDEEADEVQREHVSNTNDTDSHSISRQTPVTKKPDGDGVLDLDLSVGGRGDGQEDEVTPQECPVCLQPCIHPVLLPCQHIFCFLCVKGAANQSKRCALCRSEIPVDFFNKPNLIRKEDLLRELSIEEGYQWFYEGRNGWWQYDERTTQELEEKYKGDCKAVELLIAGFLYVIDFENMLQVRRNDPTRRRRVKRDLANTPKKGVAGLKVTLLPESTDREGAYGGDSDNRQSDGAKPKNTPLSTNIQDNENNNDSPSLTSQTEIDSMSSTDDVNSQMAALSLSSSRPSRNLRRRRCQRNATSNQSSNEHTQDSPQNQ